MKLLYYIPAIGSPNLDKKLKILQDNLNYIYKQINKNFSIIINCYNEKDTILNSINNINFLDNIYFYYKPGILTELWLTNPDNEVIKNFDYILFILDDVLIGNIDLLHLITIKKLYNITIFSPKIIQSTHRYMNQYSSLTLNNALEVYCLLLTPNDFNIYASINSIENKWMWGVDLLFGYFNINAGVYNKYYVTHVLKSQSNYNEAYTLCINYIKKYNFNSITEINANFPPVKKIINLD